jgi:hypothetical protein
LIAAIATAAAMAVPYYFEQNFAVPSGTTVFQKVFDTYERPVDFNGVAVEGNLIILVVGIVLYALHRLGCLITWTRSLTFIGVSVAYFLCVCLLPFVLGIFLLDGLQVQLTPVIDVSARLLIMSSPMGVMVDLFNEWGSLMSGKPSTDPFYIFHAVLLCVTFLEIRRRGRKVRQLYLPDSATEARR